MSDKETVKYFYEVIVSENKLGELARYCTAACAEEMRRHLAAVRSTYPDHSVSVIRQYEEDGTVVSEIVMRGTHRGGFLGITPTGRTIEITGVNIDRVVDGKIAEHRGAANTFEAFWENGLIKPV